VEIKSLPLRERGLKQHGFSSPGRPELVAPPVFIKPNCLAPVKRQRTVAGHVTPKKRGENTKKETPWLPRSPNFKKKNGNWKTGFEKQLQSTYLL
jgi:hypothetical protein